MPRLDLPALGRCIRTWAVAWPCAILLLMALVLMSCAAGPNAQVGSLSADGVLAGFWRGLWHGLIIPVSFIVSLFTNGVGIYDVHNSGGWYDFGFVLGASCALGGCGGGATHRARRKS